MRLLTFVFALMFSGVSFAETAYFISDTPGLEALSGSDSVWSLTVTGKPLGNWATGASECDLGTVYGSQVIAFNDTDHKLNKQIEIWSGAALPKNTRLFGVKQVAGFETCADDGQTGSAKTYYKYYALEVGELDDVAMIKTCTEGTGACKDKYGRPLGGVEGWATGGTNNCTVGDSNCCASFIAGDCMKAKSGNAQGGTEQTAIYSGTGAPIVFGGQNANSNAWFGLTNPAGESDFTRAKEVFCVGGPLNSRASKDPAVTDCASFETWEFNNGSGVWYCNNTDYKTFCQGAVAQLAVGSTCADNCP